MSSPATAGAERPSRPEGLVLAGKYRLVREIGSGSAGTVYEAENVAIRRRVAVKVMDARLAKTPEAVTRFEREAQAAGRLGHAHIVEVLDLGATADGVPFIVMEYLEGATLREVLGREGSLEVPRAVDIALQVLGVLQAAHDAGIIHRDLKPENVFLTQRGQRGDFVKVLDFGVAKFSEPGDGNLTDQGMTVGTPNYMSPEQVRGKDLDARSDLYSLAVVLWEMLAGRQPHEGANSNEKMISIVTKDPPPLVDVRPGVDPRLSAVLARAMRRAPGERIASARELAAALEPFGAAMEIDVGDEVVSLPPRAVAALAPTVREPSGEVSDTSPDSIPVVPSQREIPTEYVSVTTDRRIRRARGPGGTTIALAVVALLAAAGLVVWASGTGEVPARTPSKHLPPPMLPTPPPRPQALASPPAPPTPAPAAPTRVVVEIDANVAGAFVTLDGVPLGTTPLRTDVAPSPGEHDVEVSADDRVPERHRVRLDAPVRLAVELAPLPSPGPRGPRRPVAHPPPGKTPRPPSKEGTFDPFRRP